MKILEDRAYFNIGNNEYYEGYHIKDRRWNGFATPGFEKNIADLIAHNFSTSDYKIEYDKKKDCYYINEYEYGNLIQSEQVEKETIDTIDGSKDVYYLGACYWTWHDYTLEEAKNDPDANIIGNENINKDNEPVKENEMEVMD